ncbi:c-type cytochrome [Dokdonella sp.]|uniref:c-type cytochrome n=1 Tax=Dokdonella sp. TaxID=2291710 RepID=UPI003C4E8711
MFKRLLLAIFLLILIGVAGIFVLGWHSAYDPIEPTVASALDPDTVARGEMLASAGYCATCHTTSGGSRNAGGRPMATEFGTIYSTNITPDADTGIGTWSEAAFTRAMREGIARDGTELLPAFPFDHFTKLTDDDIGAIYAYLMSQPAVIAPARKNELPFPLNIRSLQAGWKLLYLDKGVYQPDTDKGAEWNRGAYLAEGLGHCGACHTPRNALGAERKGAMRFAGAFIDGWHAPALDSSNTAPISWDVNELTVYLRNGATALHGVAAGPMSEVIHEGLSALPDDDIRAMAVYFADINGTAGRTVDTGTQLAALVESSTVDPRHSADAGSEIYRYACASCHYNSAVPPALLRPDLALNTALTGPDPTNLIQVIVHGVGLHEGISGTLMPSFGTLSDADIETLAVYLRSQMTVQPAWTDLPKHIAAVRQGESDS